MPKATISSEPGASSSEELGRVAESLSVLARSFSPLSPHEQLMKEAGVRLDRAGSALLFKLYRHESGRLRVSDLAELLGIDTPAVPARFNSWNDLGYVTSESDPDDKRAKLISLTQSGEKTIDRCCPRSTNASPACLSAGKGRSCLPLSRSLERFAESLTNEMENDRD